jgi:hypothetical protein
LFAAKLFRFLILAIRLRLQPLTVESVSEFRVQRVVSGLQRDCFAKCISRALPLLLREAFIANGDEYAGIVCIERSRSL